MKLNSHIGLVIARFEANNNCKIMFRNSTYLVLSLVRRQACELKIGKVFLCTKYVFLKFCHIFTFFNMLGRIEVLRRWGLLLQTEQRGLSVCLCACLSVGLSQSWLVSPAKNCWTEPIEMPFGLWTRVEACIRWSAHWRNPANTTETSMCDGYAVLCQITLTTCWFTAKWPLFP